MKPYQGKDFAAALKALDDMVALGRQAHVDQAVSGARYNKACIHALMGQAGAAVAAAREAVAAGLTNVAQFAADSDFAGIRTHPAWAAFARELREKYGPRPLGWDVTRTASPFALILDPPSHSSLLAMRTEFAADAVVEQAGSDEYRSGPAQVRGRRGPAARARAEGRRRSAQVRGRQRAPLRGGRLHLRSGRLLRASSVGARPRGPEPSC